MKKFSGTNCAINCQTFAELTEWTGAEQCHVFQFAHVMQNHHVTCSLDKTLLFVFAHAFTEDLFLLQPALEAVKQLLEVSNTL